MSTMRPTYYVRHPDDTYSVADPQPVEQTIEVCAALCESLNQEYGEHPEWAQTCADAIRELKE